MNIFTYGTLCIPRVMNAVCGRLPPADPALLQGYSNTLVRAQCFPGIQPKASSQTTGLLYRGLSPNEVTALDAFECDFYDRQEVEVTTSEGRVKANAYIVSPAQRHQLTDQPWDEAFFIQHHLSNYL